MPHAATLLRVCSMQHQSPLPPAVPLPDCYVRGRAVALSRCCLRSLRAAQPKVFSDFVIGLFAGTHTKLACHSDLYDKELATCCTLSAAACPAAPAQARLEFIRHTSADIV